MTINGQQVQVWVPMNASGGGVAYGRRDGGRRGGAGDALGSSPPRGGGARGPGWAGTLFAAGPAGAPQMFPGHPGAGGGCFWCSRRTGSRFGFRLNRGITCIPATPREARTAHRCGRRTPRAFPARRRTRADGALRRMDERGFAMRGACADGISGSLDGSGSTVRHGGGVPLGLGLKRSDSLQQMVESSGLLDGDEPNAHPRRGEPKAAVPPPRGGGRVRRVKLEGGAMDADMFRDAEMLEEDALDAILAHARDDLLSFDGMDEAMLEAAAGPEQGVRRA